MTKPLPAHPQESDEVPFRARARVRVGFRARARDRVRVVDIAVIMKSFVELRRDINPTLL